MARGAGAAAEPPGIPMRWSPGTGRGKLLRRRLAHVQAIQCIHANVELADPVGERPVLRVEGRAEDRPRYETEVRTFYDRLRTTWERAVEEVLFNDAIRRFGKEVQTQRLKNLHRLTEQHLADLDAGMTRASEWIQGHDHAADLALPIPEPHEVAADLDTLEQWVKTVRTTLQS